MSVSIVQGKLAGKLAAKYTPVVYQEFTDIRDCLTPIILDSFMKKHSDDLLLAAIVQPTLYYKISEDENWLYCFYMTYHPFDWSNFSIEFIRKLDEHRHDTESILMRVAKKSTGTVKKGRVDICTVYHKSFLFENDSDGSVYIQAEGHGIKPFNFNELDKEKNLLRYNSFDLVNWSVIPNNAWATYRKFFSSKVNLPDEQFDSRMRKRFTRSCKVGDIWHRPDVLFNLAERMHYLNR
jgi:hypothetical protein